MFYKIALFLFGFMFLIIGCTYIILYLNLLTIGYSFKEYIIFILTHTECLLSILGIILILISIYKRRDKNE